MRRTEIYTSRKKSLKLLLIALAFVILGSWFVIKPDTFHRNELFLQILGVITILFFCLGLVIAVKQIFSKQLALVLDDKGLHVHPKKLNKDYIPWSEINGFEDLKIKGQKFLLINVKHPQEWLAKEKSVVRKKLMKFNIQEYGTPFNIAVHSWDVSHDKLKDVLERYLKQYT